MLPTSDEQIRFLVNLQRLLDEGSFVASLQVCAAAVACRSVHREGRRLGRTNAGRYRRHCREVHSVLLAAGRAVPVARQGEGTTAERGAAGHHRELRDARAAYGDSLPNLMKNGTAWRSLVTKVARVVRAMPLQYLQNVGGKRLDFLYGEVRRVIELRPGVAFCFRKFHALIGDLVRGAWVRYVRRQNLDVLGETADLNEFLFGSERAALAVVRPVLMDIQRGRCFYCRAALTPAATHVDHFIAWARYPVALGHNFVLADSRCNNQ